MDDRRFDDLTRAFGATPSRRQVLRALAGAAVAAFVPVVGQAARCGGAGEQCGCCRSGLTCANGRCCPRDRVCNGACCPAGYACRAGACVRGGGGGNPGGCPPGYAKCSGTCVAITADIANCGACGVVCATPADPCLVSICQGGVCAVAAGNDGDPCDDGDACTQTNTCQGGSCVGSNPVVCQPLDQCHTAGVCDPTTGQCSTPNRSDGALCNDGNACTVNDTCQRGVCTGGNPVVCFNLDPCVTTACDPAVGCTTTPLPAGTPCPDFSRCDGDEVCDGAGACVEGMPVTCAAPGQCQEAGVCDPSTGDCVYANKANGIACDTGNPCTADVCVLGVCHEGPDVVSPTCSAANQCHEAGTCDPTTGQCTHPDRPNSTPCDDGNPCTSGDSCQAGLCVGTPVVCPAGQTCGGGGAPGECGSPTCGGSCIGGCAAGCVCHDPFGFATCIAPPTCAGRCGGFFGGGCPTGCFCSIPSDSIEGQCVAA